MSTIGTSTKALYKGVGVMRDILPLARVHYDIVVTHQGIAGFAIWARNTFRIPIISHVKDMLKRRSRAGKTVESAVAVDERHFSFNYDDVQGIVTDGSHKEIQILTNNEQMTILFRSPDDYEDFVSDLNSQISDKVFSRDDVEVTPAVYVS